MVNYKKILGQTSAFGYRRSGGYNYPIYKVEKTVTAPADHILGMKATYSEVATRIMGEMIPFSAKDWGNAVTENFADFSLSTNEVLNWDLDDESLNDEIQYNDVRYRIIKTTEYDRVLFDDWSIYALRRLGAQVGGP